MRSNLLLLCGVAILCAGCQAARLQRQGIDFRQAVTAMYSDQLLDDLIRARNDEPFVLLRYRDLLVEETDLAELAGNYGNSTSDVGGLTISSASLAMQSRTVGTSFGLTPKVSRTAKMSFQADPLEDQDESYAAIVQFAKDPDCFSKQRCEPSPGTFHPGTKSKRSGYWYFVPENERARRAFMNLALAVSFGGSHAAKGFYEVTIGSVDTAKAGPPGKETSLTYFSFDKLVPNDNGFLIIPTADPHAPEKIEVNAVGSTETLLGKPTRRLIAVGSPAELARLKGLAGHLYLFSYSPEMLKPNARLEKSVDQMRGASNRIQGQ